MHAFNIKIQKIHHFVIHNAIDQVPNSTAEQKNQASERDLMISGCLKIENQNCQNRDDRENDE